MATHPRMLAPYTVLSEYYYADGEFEKGLTMEREGVWALLGEAPVMETQVALSKSGSN